MQRAFNPFEMKKEAQFVLFALAEVEISNGSQPLRKNIS
jgi:hypothetical protein